MKKQKEHKWTMSFDSGLKRYVVRRGPKQERLPYNQYKSFAKDKMKMEEFLNRLNYRILKEEERRKNWEIQSSFLKSSLTGDRFFQYLMENTENEKYAYDVVSRVKRYFVDFFQSKKIFDYIEWQTLKSQRMLVSHLLKKELSVKTIQQLKININQFYRFLHIESEREIDLYKVTFPSLKKNIKKKHENSRIEKNKHRDRRISGDDYIDEKLFKRMIDTCKKNNSGTSFTGNLRNLIPYIWLSYHYGLRRSEAIAVKEYGTITEDSLRITCQMETSSKIKALKHYHTDRKIPHYYESRLIVTASIIDKIELIHPSTLTSMWSNLMSIMGLRFTYHNIRNSYCSNLFRDSNDLEISPSHIQLAMGHEDIRTTMKYLRDYRQLKSNKVVKLKKFLDLDEAV